METVLHNIIQATGWSLLHSLWQGALIYALLLPFQTKAFRLSSKLKYSMAYAANCLTFLCFVFTFISIFHWPSASTGMENFTNRSIALPKIAQLTLVKYVENAFPYLVLLYSIGLFVQSFIVIQGYKRVQVLKNASYAQISGEWQALFSRLRITLKIRKHIDFRLSDHVSVPLVIGFFKPVILFPLALAAQMDIAQVEAILIHELSHIRRNDYVFNLIRTMINTVLFFNPFVWLTGKLIDIEREHACDDLVVKITDKPLTYAHALLTLELLTDQNSPAFALAATGSNQHLYQRIKRITDMKTNYSNPKQKLLAITLTIATIVSLAWINPAKSEKNKKNLYVQTSTNASSLSDLTPVDTTKKKAKKSPKVTRVVTITDSNKLQIPPSPTAPPVPATPPIPSNLEMPEAPEAPEKPELSDIDIHINSIISPEVNKAMTDFAFKVKDMVFSYDGKSPEEIKKMQLDLQRKGLELQKSFDTPEQRAKLKKYAAEMQAKYNSPAARAKFEKLAREAQSKAALSANQQKELEKAIQKQIKFQVLTAQNKVNSPEFQIKIREMKLNNTPQVIVFESEEDQKIKQTPEYIELKKKFDKDVEDLAKKNSKKTKL